MSTPQNSKNTRVTNPASSYDPAAGSDTSKKNYTAITYGNDHGGICFGNIHKQGDVTCDVMLQGSDGRHQISLDKDGPRKGWTTATAPGTFQVQCGHDIKKGKNALFLEAVNGDIIIKATNGRVRIEGLDIDLIAKGPDNTQGNVRINANEGIELSAKNVTINGSSSYKLLTAGQAQIVANSTMRIYSSMIQGISDGSKNKDSKNGGAKAFLEKQIKTA
jgi:hypothetical protein